MQDIGEDIVSVLPSGNGFIFENMTIQDKIMHMSIAMVYFYSHLTVFRNFFHTSVNENLVPFYKKIDEFL
jgi:hypothetical protein